MITRNQKLDILAAARLYAILDSGYLENDDDFINKTNELIHGGVKVFQLRLKRESRKRVETLSHQIGELIHNAGGILILNDYIDWAIHLPVDGVHVGQDDTPLPSVKEKIRPDQVVGLSTHNLEQVRKATLLDPDYIGFGPLFATETKPDYPPIGLNDVKQAVHLIAPKAVFCIGGINKDRLRDVLIAGAERVVMVSALLLSQQTADDAYYVIKQIENFIQNPSQTDVRLNRLGGLVQVAENSIV